MFKIKKEKINTKQAILCGFLAGILQASYCLLVASGLYRLDSISPEPSLPMFGFMLFLMLFVFSAALSGLIVLGFPLYLAINQKFKESFTALFTTLITLALIGIIGFTTIMIIM